MRELEMGKRMEEKGNEEWHEIGELQVHACIIQAVINIYAFIKHKVVKTGLYWEMWRLKEGEFDMLPREATD